MPEMLSGPLYAEQSATPSGIIERGDTARERGLVVRIDGDVSKGSVRVPMDGAWFCEFGEKAKEGRGGY